MEIPSEVLEVLENYESVVLNYKKLSPEMRDELEGYYLMRDEALIRKENEGLVGVEANWTDEIKQWPEKYYVIGHDGCGNYYYLDKEDNTVGFYDHDEMSFETEAENLQQYANMISKFILEESQS